MPAPLQSLTPELTTRQYPEFFFHIQPRWVQQYAELLGHKVEEGGAVPNSFLTCFRDAEFYIFDNLQIDLSQLLHTTQSFEYFEKFFAGDTIRSVPQITRVLAKRNSQNPFVLLEFTTKYFREQTQLAESLSTLFVREPS
jgi:hypothetical protein